MWHEINANYVKRFCIVGKLKYSFSVMFHVETSPFLFTLCVYAYGEKVKLNLIAVNVDSEKDILERYIFGNGVTAIVIFNELLQSEIFLNRLKQLEKVYCNVGYAKYQKTK